MANYLSRSAVVTHPDGSISITHFAEEDMVKYEFQDEDAFIQWYMNRVAPGESYDLVQRSEIPTDRSNRKFWKVNGGKVVEDSVKVAEKKASDKAKSDRIAELKNKQNFSSQEISEIIKEYVL